MPAIGGNLDTGIQIDGGTDNTAIGNVGDRLKGTTVISDSEQLDGIGRIRTAGSDLVESLHFVNTAHPLLVNTSVTGSATIAQNSTTSSLRLTTTTSSSDTAVAQTKRYFRYNPGHSYLVTVSGNLGAKKANTRQRVGYFDSNNGLFFQQTSSTLSVVVRTSASGSPVDTVVDQSNWNLDKLDGTGSSGVNLDTSKHNLYVIDFLWHGAGRIRFGILYNGSILYCHQINTANVSTTPFMRRPSLPLRVELSNTGTAASSTTLDLVCFAYQKESNDETEAVYGFTASTRVTKKTINSTTPLPILSIRPKTTFNGVTNRVPVQLDQFEVLAIQDTLYVRILLNPTLTSASWTSVDTNSSVEYDTSATAVSGGTIIFETYIPGGGKGDNSLSSALVDTLISLDIAGTTAEIITISAAKIAGNADSYAVIGWEEFQ